MSNVTVSNVSATNITLNWTIPSYGNYVTYYTISYAPLCPDLPSDTETVSVIPSITTSSHTLQGLYSGVSYTISLRAGNALGSSDPLEVVAHTSSISGNEVYGTFSFIASLHFSTFWESTRSFF